MSPEPSIDIQMPYSVVVDGSITGLITIVCPDAHPLWMKASALYSAPMTFAGQVTALVVSS